MACVAVTSLMRTIELEFLQSNPRLVLKNREHIKSLYEKLGFLQMFVEESEKKADNCEDLIAKIRRVVSKAEYDIEAEVAEIHRLQTMDRTLLGVLEDVEQLMEMTKNAHNHDELAKDFQKIQHLGSLSSSPGSQSSSSQHYTSKFEDTMVGHDKEFEEFKDLLLPLSNNEPRKVMAVVGMGGIGKTTFARRIFHDCAVRSYFDCCGWVTITEEHNKRQVLLDLCCSVMPVMRDDFKTRTDDQLAEQLQKSLKGRRYLIVVDDIWSTDAWDNVQTYFPEHGTSSRILLTARLQEVASYACSSKLCYKMRFLDCDESWNLFCVKIQWCLNKEFETIGRKIVENCRGLPLTIVVLAGHLSAKMAVDEWKSVESTLNSLVNLDLYQHFSRILNLSYNNLPCHLKSCFLYLGAFPEDSEIEIKKVVRLWIAEGFIEEEETTTLERTGKKYLKDLINRSLIMISGRGSNGKVKTCKMHDLLHELCASKAKTEKLLCTRNSSGHDYNPIHSDGNRWLNLTLVSQLHHLRIISNKSRSVLCFDRRDWYLRVNYVKMRAMCFKMVRVLDLTALDYVGSIPSDLVLLRYLALASTRLLSSIRVWRNWNLQTLIICEDISGVRKLPRGIWELPQLRHLELYHQLIPMYTPEEVQLNLQTVYWLNSLQCTKQVFLRIPNVKELGIIAQGCISQSCLDDLICLNKLEKLKVQGSYCPIKLRPYTFPQNLKEITFAKTLMPWEAMNVISMLPKLEVLKLKNHACVGQDWELSVDRGFPELKLLLISVMDLKHWEVADDVDDDCPFPKLERLVLRNCFELKEMPSWVENLSNLKSVQLEHCHASLVTCARMIEKEQRECCGEECAFKILEFYTQSDEDQNNSEREEIKEDQKSNDSEQIDEIFEEQKKEKDIKMSVFLDARSLYIPHANNPLYWIWTWGSGREVAKLLDVCWLEIRGTVDTGCLLKMTCYSAYLVFKLDPLSQYLDSLETALTCVKYLNDKGNYGENRRCQVFLAKTRYSGDPGQFPDCRSDGWMEIKLGDFYVSSGNEGEVQMGLWNTEPHWKSGLIVRGIEVRPK